MSFEMDLKYPKEKGERYQLLLEQCKALVEGETMVMPNLANVASLLFYGLEQINWVGFYLVYGNELVLGPFQGKPACIRIPIGRGVCGTAVSLNQSQRIEDVHQFPGHIACDSASNSEIVVPIRVKGEVVGVLDIDSPLFARFQEDDLEFAEAVVRLLEHSCEWSKE